VKNLTGLKRKAEAETALRENRHPIIAARALLGSRSKTGSHHLLPPDSRKRTL
jgi:hypothetical protein